MHSVAEATLKSAQRRAGVGRIARWLDGFHALIGDHKKRGFAPGCPFVTPVVPLAIEHLVVEPIGRIEIVNQVGQMEELADHGLFPFASSVTELLALRTERRQ